MRSISLAVAFTWLITAASAQSTRLHDLPAYYDSRTGNLTIDTTHVVEGMFTGYGFDAIGPGGFRPENHTPVMSTFFVSADEDGIAESNFEGVVGGVYSLGNILPAGLSETELRDTYFHGERGGPLHRATKYYALGELGSRTHHLFEPIYSPSPFPTLNDPTVGPRTIERWAEEVLLSYDATTGGLTIDSTGERGGTFWTYAIALSAPEFNLDAFQSISTLAPGLRDDYITEFSHSGIPEGVYPLGPILPSDMTVGEVTGLLDQVRFIGEPGHWSDSLDVRINGVEMAFAFVPEPNSLLLAVVAALAVVQRRRRRRDEVGANC
jgi:hypothetical protein